MTLSKFKMALSPPLPRSPSNIKANSTLPKDTTTGARDAAKVGISGSKSLTVRSSASLASGISGAADQSSSVGSMPASRVSTDQEVDLAEKMNEDIGSKYVKGKISQILFSRCSFNRLLCCEVCPIMMILAWLFARYSWTPAT